MAGRCGDVIGWEPIQNVPLVLTSGDFMHTIRRPRGSVDYPLGATARIVFASSPPVTLTATRTAREMVWRAESDVVSKTAVPGRTPFRLFLSVTNQDTTVDDWLWVTGFVRRID